MSGSKSSLAGGNAAAEVEPLGLSVHALPAADPLRQAEQTGRGRRTMAFVLLLCALPVLASYFLFYVVQPKGRAYGDLIGAQPLLPSDLSLRTLDGTLVEASSLKGQWLLVVVDGGSCVGDCEERLYLQRQLREMLGRERDRLDKLWLIADDAPVQPDLRRTLEATPAMQLLRVDQAALAAWLQPAAGQAMTAHLYLVDPMGRWMWRSPLNPDPQRIKRDLDRLLRAAASWDRPGRQP